MIAAPAFQRLLAWLSPAFPIGGFAWSAGLETAITDAAVTDAASTRHWISGQLHAGALRADALILSHSHRASSANDFAELADLCLALTPARERREETCAMGAAFLTAARAWDGTVAADLPLRCPYPLAVGAVAARQAVPRDATLIAFLTSSVQAQISVAVRLVPIGQSDGLRILAALEPQIAGLATWADAAPLADIGGLAYAADIAQMRHETQTTRIFRS